MTSSAFIDVLKALEHPQLKEIDLSLERVERYLAAFGHPERRIPPVVHIAGTNGKGSVQAFLRAILETAGYRCHSFTSPHLVSFCERIVVAGQQITEEELLPILQLIQSRGYEYPLTFFEANTVAAFEAFAGHSADVTLLEVGLGGRFDATNVIHDPQLTVITSLSMDHAEFLGDRLEKIAFEKAGIIKPGVPAVVAPQPDEALAVIERVAAEMGAPLTIVSPQQVEAMRHQTLGLTGPHQAVNAAVAVQCIDILRTRPAFSARPFSSETISQGLESARWPARLQRLQSGPLLKIVSDDTALWLDGGHNEAAGAVLAEWAVTQAQPLAVVCGMTKLKNPATFLSALAKQAAHIYAVDINNEAYAMPREMVAQRAQEAGICIADAESVAAAVKDAYNKGAKTILICGSLYLAGRVLADNR